MPKKKIIDNKKLVKLINDGVAQSRIVKEFGFKTATQVKVAYANALMELGKVAKIKSGRGKKAAKAVSKEVVVGKRGSVIVPKELVAEMGFKGGDTFTVKKTKAGISLSTGAAKTKAAPAKKKTAKK
jgi:hypothetical protein